MSPPPRRARHASLPVGLGLIGLFLLLLGAWYVFYRDQIGMPPAGLSIPSVAAPPPDVVVVASSGVVLTQATPGKNRTMQIRHTQGQIVTTISGGGTLTTLSTPDPQPPANLVDALGQSLRDRYKVWKYERGGVMRVSGPVRISSWMPPTPRPRLPPTSPHPPVPPPARP